MDLYAMRQLVLAVKPNAKPGYVNARLNARMREALRSKVVWSDLIVEGVWSSPEAIEDGTVTLVNASKTVTLADASWPVSDAVNTTSPEAMEGTGVAEVVPASMEGIEPGRPLYIDADGTPEVVWPMQVSADSFMARFAYEHNAGYTITASSLAGLQFRTGSTSPVFTVDAVVSATSLLLDKAWGGEGVSGQSYSIYAMYLCFGVGYKHLFGMMDASQQAPLDHLNTSRQDVDVIDPMRQRVGSPGAVFAFGNSRGGVQLHEVWPAPKTVRQFPYAWYRTWPDLVSDSDTLPPLFDGAIIAEGATADVLRVRDNKEDPFYNPGLARDYEMRFKEGVERMKSEDASKLGQMLTTWYGAYVRGGDWRQTHLVEAGEKYFAGNW